MRRSMLAAAAVAALALPDAAGAQTVVAPDPAAQQVTALDGTVVWVSGAAPGQTLRQRTAAGIGPVEGAPAARFYRSIDLGRDASGRLVLTYLRCLSGTRCTAIQDDLRGHRRSLKGLAPARCSLSTAPALWRTRAVYGALCRNGRTADRRRTGLYVKTGAGAPRRLPLPRDAVRFGVVDIDSVDVRGTQVAAVAADIFEYAFTETAGGRRIQSFLAAASEGDSDEHTRGLALGPGGALWTLVDSEHPGDPNQAVVFRLAGGCLASQRLVNPPGQESGFRAVDLAVDGPTLYLLAPGTGIVTHDFVPDGPCVPRD